MKLKLLLILLLFAPVLAMAQSPSPKKIEWAGFYAGINRTTPIQDFTKLKRKDFDISVMALVLWHPTKKQTFIIGVRYMQGIDRSNYRQPLFQISLAKQLF